MLLLASVSMGGGWLMIGVIYAPQSPQQCPRLAETFWWGLCKWLSAIELPFMLGIDANYPMLPLDKLNVDV